MLKIQKITEFNGKAKEQQSPGESILEFDVFSVLFSDSLCTTENSSHSVLIKTQGEIYCDTSSDVSLEIASEGMHLSGSLPDFEKAKTYASSYYLQALKHLANLI